MSGVGVLGEGPLHAALKEWYRQEGDRLEVPLDGYVVDLLRDDLVVEVQTGSFAKVAAKLTDLVQRYRVRLVHPVVVDRVIARVDPAGELLSRRRSPKHGGVQDLFTELVACPTLLAHPSFSLVLVAVRAEEIRRFDARRAWRRKGWVVAERRLLEVLDTVALESPTDLRALVPAHLVDPFTTADLAEAWQTDRRLAQRAVYCLRMLGMVSVVDHIGNARVYTWSDPGLCRAPVP